MARQNILLLSLLFIAVSLVSLAPATFPDEGAESKTFLLRDEGLSQLSYVNLADPSDNWHVAVPKGRDLQLVGQGKVLIGTESGYEERDIATGEKAFEVTSFPGTIAARRLRNGNTLLVGLNWQGERGIVLVETDGSGAVKNKIVYPGFEYVRLVRETPKGTFLVTANGEVFEGDKKGKVLWKGTVAGRENPHAWQAVKLANGQTAVSTGYGDGVQFFDKKGNLIKTVKGPQEVNPKFYSGMQILRNGNIVVANWQGHGPEQGKNGKQLIELSQDGDLVWAWKQDPEHFSSIQGVIVLDGLDTEFLHVEGKDGALVAVK